MKRKLVKHGESTLMVSLPSQWLKQQNLIKGSDIEIKEEEGRLVIGGEGKRKEKTKEIFLESNYLSENRIRDVIAGAYTAGVDVLKLGFNDPEIVIIIQKVANSLMGYEVIDQNENSCTIKNLAIPHEIDLINHLKKLFYLLKMQNALIKDQLINNKKRKIQESLELKQTVEKTRDFVCRELANSHSEEKSCFYYTLFYLIERVSVESINLLKYVKTQDVVEISTETKKYFVRVNELLDRFARHFFSKNFKDNITLMKEKDFLAKELYYKLSKDKKNNSVVLHHCASMVKIISDMNSQFLGILF